MNGHIDYWQEGYDAYHEGADEGQNPHEPDSAPWELWREGWFTSADDVTE